MAFGSILTAFHDRMDASNLEGGLIMTSRWRKVFTAVMFALVFCVAQTVADPGHDDSGGGNDPPCRRGGNPSPRAPCHGQPHPEDPADCDCGIGNDGYSPPRAHEKGTPF
jgi:hypothetical protein